MRTRATERGYFATLSGTLPTPVLETANDDDKGGKKPSLKELLKENDGLQDEIDEVIETRLARERRRLKADGGGSGGRRKEDEDLQKELDDLRAFKTQKDQDDAAAQKNYETALGIEREKFGTKEAGWKKREGTLVGELRKERVRGRLIAAAAAAGAVDPGDVADMLERRVDLDDDFNPFIRNDKDATKRALNAEGDDLTIDELVDDFLTKKPHLAKASDGSGASAKGGASTESGRRVAGKDTADIAALRKKYEDAQTTAKASPSTGNLTRLTQAKRALENAEKAAA